MTINEVLAEVQELKPSQYDEALMIKWISRIEAKIINDIIKKHVPDEKILEKMKYIDKAFYELYAKEEETEDTEEETEEDDTLTTVDSDDDGSEEFTGYDETDYETDLLVDEPYTDVYRFYVMSMIDYYNGETARYANSSTMFNNSYLEYAGYYNSTHEPVYEPLKVF